MVYILFSHFLIGHYCESVHAILDELFGSLCFKPLFKLQLLHKYYNNNNNDKSKFIGQIATYEINKDFTDCIVFFL